MNARNLTLSILTLFFTYGVSTAQDTIYRKHEAPEVMMGVLHPNKDERQYITAELIRLQGIARMHELISWIDKAYFTTNSGSEYAIGINGSSSFQQQNVLLFINGVKTDLPRYDALNLEILGIPINDIAYVEIITTPQYFSGQLITQGAINIVTRKDEKGLAVKSVQQAAINNHQNYPASLPTLQNKRTEVNGTTLGYYGNKGHLKAAYVYQSWYPADSNIYNHIWQPNNGRFRGTLEAWRMEGAYQLKRNLIEISYTQNKQVCSTYNPFWEAYVPTNIDYKQTQFRLTRPLGNNYILRISGSHLDYQQTVSNSSYLNPTHTLGMVELYGLNKRFRNKPLKTVLSYTTELHRYVYIPQDRQYNQTISGEATLQNTKKTTHKLALQAKYLSSDTRIYPALLYTYNKNANFIHSWSFSLAYKTTSLNEYHNQLWLYNQYFNYRFNRYHQPVDKPTHQISANYFKKLNFNGNFRFTFHTGWQTQFQAHGMYNLPITTWPSTIPYWPTSVVADIHSALLGINVHYDVLTWFWVDADFYNVRSFSDSKEMQQVISTQPRRKLNLSANFKLGKKTDLSIRFLAQSQTTWNYLKIPFYIPSQDQINARYNTDITINRKLLHDWINLTVGAKNIFNQANIYQTNGAMLNARYFASVAVQLQQIGKKTRKP